MVVVLALYALGAYGVLALGVWLRRTLVLPPLFDGLLRVGLLAGALVAAALAWSYPRLATGSSSADAESASPGTETET